MKKLYLTRELQPKVMNFLEEKFEFSFNKKDRILTKNELIEQVQKNDILLCLLTDNIDKDVISANPNLLGISNYAVGYNNIDVDFATKLKIPVTNTPGVLTETTAELAISLIFSLARRIPEADKWTRKGNYKGWKPNLFLGTDIHDKNLGIIGAGRIGSYVAQKCKYLGMNVFYNDNARNEVLEKNGIKRRSFEEIVEKSDFISIHVPLLDSTYHLFDLKEFNSMKKNSFLINTSRGKIINENSLYNALKEKKIKAAALDVFEFEPKITEGLKELNNIILVPHIGSASVETRTKMGMLAAKNALQLSRGEIPKCLVNKNLNSEI